MSRTPDYIVGAINKRTDDRQPKIGAAWVNEDGTITVALDPFVVLPGGKDTLITLFPKKERTDA